MRHYRRAFAGWDLTCQHLQVPGKYYAASSPAPQPCHQAAGLAVEYRGRDHHRSYTFKTAKQNIGFSKKVKLLDTVVAPVFCILLSVHCNFPTFKLRVLLGRWSKENYSWLDQRDLIVLRYILHTLSSIRIEFQQNCDKEGILNFYQGCLDGSNLIFVNAITNDPFLSK